MSQDKVSFNQDRFNAAFGNVNFFVATGLLSGTRPYNGFQSVLLEPSASCPPAPQPVGLFRFIRVPTAEPGVHQIIALAADPVLVRKVNSLRRRQWVESMMTSTQGLTRKVAIDIWCQLRGNPTELALVTVEIISLFIEHTARRIGVKLSELKDLGIVATNPVHRRLVSVLNASFTNQTS